MSLFNFGDIFSVAGFIIATCFFYRLGIKQSNPKGFCLFLFRITSLSAIIFFSSVFFAITILDKEIQQTFLKIGLFSGLVGFFSSLLGNFFNYGKSGA